MEELARRARILSGAAFWIAAAALAAGHIADPEKGRDRHALWALGKYLFGREVAVVLRFPAPVEIAAGDPLYRKGADGILVPLGEVKALLRDGARLPLKHAYPEDGVREVLCDLRGDSIEGSEGGLRGRLYNVPQTMSWVIRTLIPPEKMAALALEWNGYLLEERDEILRTMNPLLKEFLRCLEKVLEADLPAILRAHKEELGAIGSRINEEIIEKEFKPIVATDLWPLIERRARPAIEALSSELWREAPLWGIAWRTFYQALPFTSDRSVREEIERFIRTKAVPILRAHAGEFIEIARDAAREASGNERLGEAFRRSFDRFLDDDEIHALTRTIFKEALLDNPRFHEEMEKLWASPTATGALEELSSRLEPMVRRIGVQILGTPEGGITPEFARVLRTQILRKDSRWVLIERVPEGPGTTGPGIGTPEPGMVIPADVERR